MIPQKLPLTPFTEGDTWEGIPSISITVGPVGGPFAPPTADLSSVTMRFKKLGGTDADVVELSSAAGKITITSANLWTFTVPPQIVAGLSHGKWAWRIRCTSNAGADVATYLADEITVLESV